MQSWGSPKIRRISHFEGPGSGASYSESAGSVLLSSLLRAGATCKADAEARYLSFSMYVPITWPHAVHFQ